MEGSFVPSAYFVVAISVLVLFVEGGMSESTRTPRTRIRSNLMAGMVG